MASGPIVRIHGIKQKIPPGFVIGRLDTGGGQPQLIPISTLGRRMVGSGAVASAAAVANALANFNQVIAATDETTAITTGLKTTFRMTQAVSLTEVRASLTTAQPSGSIFTVDITQNGVSIFSTLLTIDNTETTSTTAATPPVLTSNPLSLADHDEMKISVTQVGAAGAAGLKIYLIGTTAA